jgi:hypothetical protein
MCTSLPVLSKMEFKNYFKVVIFKAFTALKFQPHQKNQEQLVL